MSDLRALVTGATRGLGLAITKELQERGIKVVGLGKSEENLTKLKEQFPEIDTVCVDLSDWKLTREIISKLGHFNYLVNNAAYGIREKFFDITEDELDKSLSVNLKAVLNVSQVVAQGMRDSGIGGSIINISSSSSKKTYKNLGSYSISKAALNKLTEVMALELGPYKIRVNGVCPEVVQTDMSHEFFSRPELIAKLETITPLGRICEPVDVAKIVSFLLNDDAFMVNGVNLNIDGGVHII